MQSFVPLFILFPLLFLNSRALQYQASDPEELSVPAASLYNTSSCDWRDEDTCISSYPYQAVPCNETYTDTGWPTCQVPYFNESIFMQTLQNHCGVFQEPLEACTDDYAARRSAAEVWSLCFSRLFADFYRCNEIDENDLYGSDKSGNVQFSMDARNFVNVDTVPISNDTCSYPSFIKVLHFACDRILENLEKKSWCCGHTTYDIASNEEIMCRLFERKSVNFEVLACQTEAAIHYTRCTSAGLQDEREVGYCVRNATLGLGYFNYELLVDNGDPKCPTVSSFMRRLILWNVCALGIIIVLASRRLLCWIFLQKKKFDDTMEFSMLSLIFDLCVQVGATVGTAILTQRKGHSNDIAKHVQLWALRPRAAAPTALLGYFHNGYVGKAIKLMVIDVLLSLIALKYLVFTIQKKTGVNAFFGDDWAKPNLTIDTSWEVYEQGPPGWTLYRKGGIVSLVPTGIFIFLLFASIFTCICPGVSVFMTLREFTLRLAYCCHRTKANPIMWKWGSKVQWTLYTIMFLISFVLYIGNWMVWVNFLKVAGPLYCPGSLKKIDVIWFTTPVLMNLVGLLVDVWSECMLGSEKFAPPDYALTLGSDDPTHSQGAGFNRQYPKGPANTSQQNRQTGYQNGFPAQNSLPAQNSAPSSPGAYTQPMPYPMPSPPQSPVYPYNSFPGLSPQDQPYSYPIIPSSPSPILPSYPGFNQNPMNRYP